jgi:hypothetical protein
MHINMSDSTTKLAKQVWPSGMFKFMLNFWDDEYCQTFCKTLSTKYQPTEQLLPLQYSQKH